MHRRIGRLSIAMTVLLFAAPPARAQQAGRVFVGAIGGVSTLSADGRAVISPSEAATSLYKPENGLALNLFAGVHLGRFFSAQGNYMWNRNDVTLVSSLTDGASGSFYEQHRRSQQHAFVADALIYFRALGSAVRPYLGTGVSLVRFTSHEIVRTTSAGLPAPEEEISATKLALRSHVGIDFAISRRVTARYSFSETIGGNPISPHLMPMGERRLANFQNLFGIVWQF